MKKYTSRATKWLAVFASIFSVALLIGVVLLVADPTLLSYVVLVALIGVLAIFFFCLFLGERSRALLMDDEKVIFARGADRNGNLVLQKTVVKFSDICSVESKLHKGDGIISLDCFFYTLILKDGTKIKVHLYDYGKEAEKEIVETIRENIKY